MKASSAKNAGCFTRLWVGYPRCVMLINFLIICGSAALSFVVGEFKEPVNTGWTNRAHIAIQRLDAWYNMGRGEYFYVAAEDDGSSRRHQRRLQSDDEEDERVWIRDQLTILYQGSESLFAEETVAKMVDVESALLSTPSYATHCTLVQPTDGAIADGRCRSPLSVLTLLHTNPSAHEAQCRAGFCILPTYQLACGPTPPQIPWGDLPCVSQVFDWREGTLAPPSEWEDLLTSALQFQEAAGYPPAATLRVALSELKNASQASVQLSSLLVRARFDISTQTLYDSSYTSEVMETLADAFRPNSALQPGAKAVAEPAAGEVNIFWLSWAPAGLLPNVYADMLLALASLSFILLCEFACAPASKCTRASLPARRDLRARGSVLCMRGAVCPARGLGTMSSHPCARVCAA